MVIRRLSGITLGYRSSNPSWPTQGYLTSKPNTSHTGHTHQKRSVAQAKSPLSSGEVTAQNMCCLPSVACHLCHRPWKCYCSEKIWYHCSFYLGYVFGERVWNFSRANVEEGSVVIVLTLQNLSVHCKNTMACYSVNQLSPQFWLYKGSPWHPGNARAGSHLPGREICKALTKYLEYFFVLVSGTNKKCSIVLAHQHVGRN